MIVLQAKKGKEEVLGHFKDEIAGQGDAQRTLSDDVIIINHACECGTHDVRASSIFFKDSGELQYYFPSITKRQYLASSQTRQSSDISVGVRSRMQSLPQYLSPKYLLV